jgi:hypothetical protein
MSRRTWVQLVLAAIVVVLVGAVIAAAEQRIEVRVEQQGDDEVSVDINGVTEVIRLDDLAEGESRTFDVGDHELVVTRLGDELKVVTTGSGLGHLVKNGHDLDTMVWVTEDGERIELPGEGEGAGKKIVIMKVDGEGTGEPRIYTVHLDGDDLVVGDDHTVEIDEVIERHGGGAPHAVVITEDGAVHHPEMLALAGDVVRYRCEETGSSLVVKKTDDLADSYLCPVTGCLMTRVEEPEMRVIRIEKRVESDEE